ncbi:protein lifeguard 1-like [Aphis gossypii]|uniref:protein lifeguard 1-like n=1 Tax=Aphis gossypii TaxID=80765 RepID=UPI002158AABE|nr:protein lifeguard 1-like [Aphis gossypii]XP_050065797.1 protein lifeguard 1-like [Aphis gossypii]
MEMDIGFRDKTIRKNFLCKIYSIVMCQLIIATTFLSMATFHEPTRIILKSYPCLSIITSITTLGILIALACSEYLRRKSPVNYIFLFLITLALSFLLAVSVSQYYPNQVLLALGIATIICFAFIIFALQTKIDFTVMGSFLMVAIIILLVASTVVILIPGKLMTLITACVGSIIYSMYLIYDTQIMVGNNHRYSITPREYILGVLAIYIDIINIFKDILTIIVIGD